MKNYQFQEKQFEISDPIESYFECITTCDVRDGICISRCVEMLKENDNLAVSYTHLTLPTRAQV